MSARYVQKGESIDYRPETDVRAKTIVPFPGFVGITRLDIRAGELGALAVTGVFESPKADEAIDVGDPVYWDEANEVATKQKTDVYLGVAVYNAQASSEFVYFLLNAGSTGASGTSGSAATASPAIADLGTLTSDSGCSASMATLKETINEILEALRSANIIAAS
jgi:predicted RecA/RadA family phage recombinase